MRDRGQGEAGVQEMPLHQMPLGRYEPEVGVDQRREEEEVRKVLQEKRRREETNAKEKF